MDKRKRNAPQVNTKASVQARSFEELMNLINARNKKRRDDIKTLFDDDDDAICEHEWMELFTSICCRKCGAKRES